VADKLIEMTTGIVANYVAGNHINQTELASLIKSVHDALSAPHGVTPMETQASAPVKLTAAQIRKSVTPETLFSFEDGKGYKTLKRHLSMYGLTPQAYREKWTLPAAYPMTAPAYSARRSELAKAIGLGAGRTKSNPALVKASPKTGRKKADKAPA
jgi:predicted transcriptional regulator